MSVGVNISLGSVSLAIASLGDPFKSRIPLERSIC